MMKSWLKTNSDADPQSLNAIREVLVLLSTHYPYWEKDLDTRRLNATYALYEQLLADIPGEILGAAALAHITESRFFPTVSELRAQAADILTPERLTPLEAWDDPADPLARRVRKLLPDYHDRLITIREQAVIKALFIKTYQELLAREQREQRRLPAVRALRQRLFKKGD